MLRQRAAFAALVCACMFSACDDPPEQQAGTPAASTKAPPKTVASIPMDMVAAVSAGKSSDVIGLHFALRATPTVNTALPVEVAIVPHRDFSSLIVHFDSQEGLATTTGNTFGPQTDVKSEVALTHQLVLLPTKEGMFMVTAGVDTEGADGNTVRIFSIPVIVSGASATPAAPAPAPAEPAKQ
jgi:hypothetical protein